MIVGFVGAGRGVMAMNGTLAIITPVKERSMQTQRSSDGRAINPGIVKVLHFVVSICPRKKMTTRAGP